MSRVRIRAKAPPLPKGPTVLDYPLINGIVPTWCDVEVHLIDDNEREHELTCVERIELDLRASTEPLRAKLTILDVELDVDVKPLLVDARITRARAWLEEQRRCYPSRVGDIEELDDILSDPPSRLGETREEADKRHATGPVDR